MYFTHELTIFSGKQEKFRVINKYEKLSELASCPVFLPTFNFSFPAEFGDTKSAIYVSSEAGRADFQKYKKFLLHLEREWTKKTNDFYPESKLFPWSISGEKEMIYGSGSENLISALERCYKDARATISIILQGQYGAPAFNNSTFFIVIGSDLKSQSFGYNFIDFYLSNIPMDWDWVKSINNSLDALSTFPSKATSYALKGYNYYRWEAPKHVINITIKNPIIGGMGRNGFDERNYDSFDGLIMKSQMFKANYVLDEENSWISEFSDPFLPINCLNEFVVSVTNRPPCVEEIESKKFIGICNPRIYVLEFQGRGWQIFGLNAWGTAKMKGEESAMSKTLKGLGINAK